MSVDLCEGGWILRMRVIAWLNGQLLGTTDQFAINQEDEIIRGALVLDNGNISWPPPKVEVSVQPVRPKEESIKEPVEEKKSIFSGVNFSPFCIFSNPISFKSFIQFTDNWTP